MLCLMLPGLAGPWLTELARGEERRFWGRARGGRAAGSSAVFAKTSSKGPRITDLPEERTSVHQRDVCDGSRARTVYPARPKCVLSPSAIS